MRRRDGMGRADTVTKKVFLVCWNEVEAADKARRLRDAGYSVEHEAADGARAFKAIRACAPAAVVIDLDRVPSHGRQMGIALRERKATRFVPLVFAGGEPDKVARTRELLHDAEYCSWRGIRGALKRALAGAPAEPAAPSSRMAEYAGVPLVRKLGIKPRTSVALIRAPEGFERTLGGLPADVSIRRRARTACDLAILFVGSRKELDAHLARAAALAGAAGLWIAWPKKTSGIRSDLTQGTVRAVGLAAGLVDYKVCAIDETWSGLRFTRRKR
jgi:hypothetical protein